VAQTVLDLVEELDRERKSVGVGLEAVSLKTFRQGVQSIDELLDGSLANRVNTQRPQQLPGGVMCSWYDIEEASVSGLPGTVRD
jgi:hypothetical protein